MTLRLLTAQEVAELWSCTPEHVLKLARQREIPSVKLGRFVRFDPEELARYVAGQHREAERAIR